MELKRASGRTIHLLRQFIVHICERIRDMRTLLILLVLGIGFTSSAGSQQTDPKKLRDHLTGDAKGKAANNPQCQMFTQTEIVRFLGAAVGPGENVAGGNGCGWSDKEYESRASVTVVPPSYFPEPSGVKGFKRLPNIGKRAWVAPDDGWSAGALFDDAAIVVGLSGKTATEAAVVALLQETIKRRKK
jgi:hypothetical protein